MHCDGKFKYYSNFLHFARKKYEVKVKHNNQGRIDFDNATCIYM